MVSPVPECDLPLIPAEFGMNERQQSAPDLNLPDDLRAFLAAGKRLEYDPGASEAGGIELVPLKDLKLERFPVQTGPLPDQDPDFPGSNSFLVLGVNLVASCTGGYDPVGLLLWLPLERRYGIWDDSHGTIRVFGPAITWKRIAADPVPHIDAGWTGFHPDSPPMEDLMPWPAHSRQDRPVYDVQPLEPAVQAEAKTESRDTNRPFTKRYQTNFKGLTLGVTTLEEAKKRPDAVPGTRRARPNPLVQPDLWIGKATLHFDENDKTLFAVHIHDLGFVDVNGITVGGPWSQVEKLAGRKLNQTFYSDERNGVIYWDDDGWGKVTKIVYVSGS
jgi:hypothetical protein